MMRHYMQSIMRSLLVIFMAALALESTHLAASPQNVIQPQIASDMSQGVRYGRNEARVGSVQTIAANTSTPQRQDEESLDALERAYASNKQSGQTALAADLAQRLAVAQVRAGQYNAARLAYRDAIDLYTRAGNRPGAWRARAGLGTLAGRMGSYTNAAEILKAALDDKQGIPDAEVLNARNSLANVYTLTDRYDEARLIYFDMQEVLQKQTPQNSSLISTVSLNLAVCYSKLGQPVEAMRYIDLAKQMASSDPREYATLLNNLGLAYDSMNDRSDAVKFLNESIDVRKQLGDPFMLAQGYSSLGTVLGDRKYGTEADFSAALSAFDSAWRSVDVDKFPPFKASLLGNIGATLRNLNRYKEAEKKLLEAKRAYEALGDEAGLTAVVGNLGDLYVAQKRYNDAIPPYRAAVDLIERLRLSASDDLARMTLFEAQQNYYSVLVDLYAETGDDLAAFDIAERSRARGLLDLLSDRYRESHSPAAIQLRNEAAKLREQRLASQRRLASLDPSSPEYRHVLQARDKATGQLLETSQALADRSTALDRAGLAYISLRKIQSTVLRPREYYLSYKLTAHRLHIMLVSQTSFRRFTYRIDAKDVEAQVTAFLDAIRGQQAVGEQAHALYRILLLPVENDIAHAERLNLAAEGVLMHVPFEALTRRPTDAVESFVLFAPYGVVNVPSASVLASLRKSGVEQRPNAKPILLFGDPAYELASSKDRFRWGADCVRPQFRSLPEAKDEVRSIAAVFGLSESDPAVNLGPLATASRVREMQLDRYDLIHFAVHGVVCAYGRGSWDEPALGLAAESAPASVSSGSGISYAPGLLYASDIYQLNLNAQLVTLSACESAVGQDLRGEGVVGFTRAFLAAGARSVIASLWLVTDSSSSELMHQFYAEVAKRNGSLLADWRRARQEFVRRSPDAIHARPFYWAPFLLYGDPS